MDEFFNMNGYGFYIWGAYIFTFTVILWLFISTIYKSKKLNKEESKKQETLNA